MASCFQPAFPQLPTLPLPYKPGAAIRVGSRRDTATRRQCRGAVWRHWGQCRRAVGRHWVSSRGPDHRASPTLMADLQLQQQDPVLGPAPAAWPAKPSNMKECSTLALVQQYPRRFLKNGSSVVGRLTNVVVPVNSWFVPAHFGRCPRRGQGLHQHLRETWHML